MWSKYVVPLPHEQTVWIGSIGASLETQISQTPFTHCIYTGAVVFGERLSSRVPASHKSLQ